MGKRFTQHPTVSSHYLLAGRQTDGETNMPKMDNAGFERDRRSTVEMGEVSPPAAPQVTIATVNGNGVPGCTDLCLSLHQQHQKSLQQYQKSAAPRAPESPWHRLKTIFLASTIAFLVIWIVVYTVLSQMKVV